MRKLTVTVDTECNYYTLYRCLDSDTVHEGEKVGCHILSLLSCSWGLISSVMGSFLVWLKIYWKYIEPNLSNRSKTIETWNTINSTEIYNVSSGRDDCQQLTAVTYLQLQTKCEGQHIARIIIWRSFTTGSQDSIYYTPWYGTTSLHFNPNSYNILTLTLILTQIQLINLLCMLHLSFSQSGCLQY